MIAPTASSPLNYVPLLRPRSGSLLFFVYILRCKYKHCTIIAQQTVFRTHSLFSFHFVFRGFGSGLRTFSRAFFRMTITYIHNAARPPCVYMYVYRFTSVPHQTIPWNKRYLVICTNEYFTDQMAHRTLHLKISVNGCIFFRLHQIISQIFWRFSIVAARLSC